MTKILGHFVLPDKIISGTLIVQDGKITDLKEGFDHKASIDYRDNYILPGLIEVHGHMREPGMTQKEDIPHGTKAAIAGGFTTIIDMPNTNPPTVTSELLNEKVEQVYKNRSFCDYAFFFGVAKDKISQLEKLDAKKIVGFKVFMAGHETTPTTIPDDETLAKICEIAAKRNIILAIHAEDQNLINELEQKFKETGRTDPALWSEIRPKEVVIKAVKRALRIGKKYGTKMYFLHLSTPEEFKLIEQAKREGQKVYGELVSYQLVFNTNDYAKLGNKIKVSPALRDLETQNTLWGLFKKRNVDVFCSEHTPHELGTKDQPNVWKAQSGMPNIQETVPGIITKWIERYGKGSIENCLMNLAILSSKNPAQIFGFTQKGEIAVGKDADLVVVDIERPWSIQKSNLFSKCNWSAYEGMNFLGHPIATFLRGKKVYENGKIITDAPGQLTSF